MTAIRTPPNRLRLVESGLDRTTARSAYPAIGELSVLPVFYKLSGKGALVAGNGAAAAWKAELVAASGAIVTVHADQPCQHLLDLAADGRIRLLQTRWTEASFAEASIAVCEAGNDEEAAAFRKAGRAAGVPVNVIDSPDHCDFQFGSIVNRSPAVIAISTDGASPILGQAIRRRIEALLPASIAQWAALARQVRSRVNAAFSPGTERRAFWEKFVDHAFAGAPSPGTLEELVTDTSSGKAGEDKAAGQVVLVRVTTDEPELLTLKAVRALQAADVILHDRSVPPGVLDLARREAQREAVNWDDSRSYKGDTEMLERVADLARTGKRVVRLLAVRSPDWQDSCIASLRQQGIRVSEIPGALHSAPDQQTPVTSRIAG